jgi:predicted RNA binding protein YcfA (HicA-like mRNA interferase family)
VIKVLSTLGYHVTRQTGSHIRLTCDSPTTHSLTVPNHVPLNTGTLSAILADVAAHRHMEKATLIEILFG